MTRQVRKNQTTQRLTERDVEKLVAPGILAGKLDEPCVLYRAAAMVEFNCQKCSEKLYKEFVNLSTTPEFKFPEDFDNIWQRLQMTRADLYHTHAYKDKRDQIAGYVHCGPYKPVRFWVEITREGFGGKQQEATVNNEASNTGYNPRRKQ